MILNVIFEESKHLDVIFGENETSFDADFGNVTVVNGTHIPPQYGLVTYDHNQTITVS